MKRCSSQLIVCKISLILFAAALVTRSDSAQQPATESTPAQVDTTFADFQKPGSPGCSLGVFRDGQIIYSKGYGLASVELNAPITPSSVFDIGSTSKQFTAASILLLQQQGKLSINDDVRKYIPELPDYSKEYGRQITILNLLNHTSGLRDYLALLPFSGVNEDSVTTNDDALALIIRQKHLNFTPGSKWEYSNTGFFLLSIIVKRVSGMTLRQFEEQTIFQPLGMSHTVARDDHTLLVPQRALAYDPNDKGGYKLNVSYFEQLGDGAVHTSVEDLARWDENFYSPKVGGKSFVDAMQERGKLNNGKALDYAKGLFIGQYRGLPTVSHEGAWGGYRAELLRFPDQHFSVACLCNVGNANPGMRARKVAGVYLGSLMKPAKNAANPEHAQAGFSLTPAQASVVTGLYRDPATGTAARVAQEDGKLNLKIYGMSFPLYAASARHFLLTDPVNATIDFESAGEGAAPLQMKIGGEDLPAATYLRVVGVTPTASELAACAGDFQSGELGVVYRLRSVDGALKLVEVAEPSGIARTGMALPETLDPTIADEFDLNALGIVMHFVRDGRKKITGFQLAGAGIHGMKFVRIDSMASIPTTF